MAPTLNAQIFREYDIRGVAERDRLRAEVEGVVAEEQAKLASKAR